MIMALIAKLGFPFSVNINPKVYLQTLSIFISSLKCLTQSPKHNLSCSQAWVIPAQGLLKAPPAAQRPSWVHGLSLSSSPAGSLEPLGERHITQPVVYPRTQRGIWDDSMSLTATDLWPLLHGTPGFKASAGKASSSFPASCHSQCRWVWICDYCSDYRKSKRCMRTFWNIKRKLP